LTDIFNLSYGTDKIQAYIPQGYNVKKLELNHSFKPIDTAKELTKALRTPIFSPSLKQLAAEAKNAVIVISDQTRPLPSHLLLPVVVKELIDAGVKKGDITIVIGVGSHRPVTEREKKALMGSLYGQFKCYHSRENGYHLLGITKRGTPVEVSQYLAQAELIIALGNVEFHQMAGFTGGAKALAAGTASHRALEHNHKLSMLKKSGLGMLEDNVIRQDMEEFAYIAGLKFIINVVLDEFHNVIYLAAGDFIKAHRACCEVARDFYSSEFEKPADVVITSPGGKPKDDTVYQAQKTLRNALTAVKKGGIVIIAAKCSEGFGNDEFERWLDSVNEPDEIEQRIKKEFILGGHKAKFLAEAARKASIYWVTDMKPKEVKKLFGTPFSSLQEAVDTALRNQGNRDVIIIPWGGVTLPVMIF